jgi:hypothetical protein
VVFCFYAFLPPDYFVEFHGDQSSARTVAGAGSLIFLCVAYEYREVCGNTFRSINAVESFICGLVRHRT